VDLELRHCVSEGTLSELDLAHVSKCALGRQQLTSVVGVLIVVFDNHAPVPFMKLCLYLLRYLLTVAYFRLHEIHSTLILPLPLVCVRNNSTLVAALRIAWFIKPSTHQTICQRRHPLDCLVEVLSRSPTNIWCWCCDCGVSPLCQGSHFEALPFLTAFLNNCGIFPFA
jgi:hypothetical protein